MFYQSHKSKVGTIMKCQFYTPFEIKILYIKSGMPHLADLLIGQTITHAQSGTGSNYSLKCWD